MKRKYPISFNLVLLDSTFIYYFLVLVEVMLPSLGVDIPFNLSYIKMLLLIILMGIFLFYYVKDLTRGIFVILMNILVMSILLSVLLSLRYVSHFPAIIDSGSTVSASQLWIRFFGTTLFPGLLLMIVGFCIKSLAAAIREHYYVILVLYGFYVASVILASIYNHAGIFGTAFINTSTGDLNNGAYLPLSDAFLVVASLMRYSINQTITKVHSVSFVVDIISLYTLFRIGSRTSLLAYLFMILAIALLTLFSRQHGLTPVQFLTATVLAGIVSVFLLVGFTGVTLTISNPQTEIAQNYNRMVSIFQISGYQTDASVRGRQIIDQQNMHDLQNFWFTGRFLHEAETGMGYSHNIKSWWIEYGVISFILLVVILSHGIISILVITNNGQLQRHSLAVQLFLVYIISAIFSRSYVYPTTWLLIGIAAGLPSRRLVDKSFSSKQLSQA